MRYRDFTMMMLFAALASMFLILAAEHIASDVVRQVLSLFF
jgi:hypothetical protein